MPNHKSFVLFLALTLLHPLAHSYPTSKVYENQLYKLSLPADKEWKVVQRNESSVAMQSTTDGIIYSVFVGAFSSKSSDSEKEFIAEADSHLKSIPLPSIYNSVKRSPLVKKNYKYKCIEGNLSAQSDTAPRSQSTYYAKLTLCRHPKIDHAGVVIGYSYIGNKIDPALLEQHSYILNSLEIKGP